MNGSQFICRQLEHFGVRHVFGLPGTQNAQLISEMATSKLQLITTVHEMGAAFAGLGYAIASRQPAVLLTIAGPGFCYAVSPLVEAAHDSIPLLHMVVVKPEHPTRQFQLQAMDHQGLASSFAKSVQQVSDVQELPDTLITAWAAASDGEPGPVVVLINSDVLEQEISASARREAPGEPAKPDMETLDRLCRRLQSGKTLVLAGGGALGAKKALGALVAKYDWPVMTTTSGRGLLPEDVLPVLPIDQCPVAIINEILARFDTILAIGVKFSHNSSRGYQLKITKDQLVHIDADKEVLNANYSAGIALQCDARAFCEALQEQMTTSDTTTSVLDTAELRSTVEQAICERGLEPRFAGVPDQSAAEFFRILKDTLPDDAIIVTDSGAHQMLARRYVRVRHPNGLITPINFQSMGFGLPAGIGVALAHRGRTVAIIHGDGGFRMCAQELLTAVREQLPIRIIIIDDGYFGLIRNQQLGSGDFAHGIDLPAFDYGQFAESVGARFYDATDGLATVLANCSDDTGPVLIRQPVTDSPEQHRDFTRRAMRGRVRRVLGPRVVNWLRRQRR